jgi:hypothetical protein
MLSEVNGIRLVTMDDGAATTGLTLVLRAGARYAPAPGLAHLLDKFAWKVRSWPEVADVRTRPRGPRFGLRGRRSY